MFCDREKDRQDSEAHREKGGRQVLQLKSSGRRLVARGQEELQDAGDKRRLEVFTSAASRRRG